MRADARGLGWQRWREAAFATCTAWLVLQNMVLLALLAWGNPVNAWPPARRPRERRSRWVCRCARWG